MHDTLRYEFGFSDIATQDIGSLLGSDVVQAGAQFQDPEVLFALAEPMVTGREELVLILAPVALITPFGYRIAGETRGKCIAVSSLVVTSRNFLRLLRHEMGHYFGLSEHLDCVMSPYTVEDPRFCRTCVCTLRRLGVDWQGSSGEVAKQ
jgi:hypothetical protein